MLKRLALVVSLLVVCMGSDQVTKRMAIESLQNQPTRTYLNSMFQLFYAENKGAFGSLGADWMDRAPDGSFLHPLLAPCWWIFFVILPIIVLGAVTWHAIRSPSMDLTTVIASTLVTAGGLGNVVDRIVQQHVVDFMYIRIGSIGGFQVATNVFNVADLAVMGGVILLLIHRPKPPATAPQTTRA